MKKFLSILLVSFTISVPLSSQAVTIFDNGVENLLGSAYSDLFQSFIHADNFTLSSNSIVSSVSWYGGYGASPNTPAPATDKFVISFYSDVTGEPGAVLESFNVGDDVNRTATGNHANLTGSYATYNYTASIASSLFTAGSNYWLSIANEAVERDNVWFWSLSSNRGSSYTINEDGLFNNNVELAFSLDGGTASTVPEPPMLLLLGAAFIGLVGRKYKR